MTKAYEVSKDRAFHGHPRTAASTGSHWHPTTKGSTGIQGPRLPRESNEPNALNNRKNANE